MKKVIINGNYAIIKKQTVTDDLGNTVVLTRLIDIRENESAIEQKIIDEITRLDMALMELMKEKQQWEELIGKEYELSND